MQNSDTGTSGAAQAGAGKVDFASLPVAPRVPLPGEEGDTYVGPKPVPKPVYAPQPDVALQPVPPARADDPAPFPGAIEPNAALLPYTSADFRRELASEKRGRRRAIVLVVLLVLLAVAAIAAGLMLLR